MHQHVQRFVVTLSLTIIIVFGLAWVLGAPTVTEGAVRPLPEWSGRPTIVAGEGDSVVPQQNETPTPTSTVPIFPTAEPFPTDEPFPTEDPSFPTVEPFPTDEMFPTDDPAIPTDDPEFPTADPCFDPYPNPEPDPYPAPCPTYDPGPQPCYPEYPAPNPNPCPTPTSTETPYSTATPYPTYEQTPTLTPTRKPRTEEPPAFLLVVQRQNPNRFANHSAVDFGAFAAPQGSVPNDGIVDTTITITNRGAGRASDATVTLPFDSRAVRILDATFSEGDGYVIEVNKDTTPATLTFSTGRIEASATVVVTIRLLVRPDAPNGTTISQRLTYRWEDDRSGGTGTSNLPTLIVGDADDNTPYEPLTVTRTNASTYAVDTKAFFPGESVSVWYQPAGGAAVAIGSYIADPNGAISTSFNAALPPGDYTVVATGVWSGITATGAVRVTQ